MSLRSSWTARCRVRAQRPSSCTAPPSSSASQPTLAPRFRLPGSRSLSHSVAISSYKTTQSADELVAVVQSFGEKPLQGLAKRGKNSDRLDAKLTTREQAFLVFCESLARALPDSATCVPFVARLCESLADLSPAVFRSCLSTCSSRLSRTPARRSTRRCRPHWPHCRVTRTPPPTRLTSSGRAASSGLCATGSRRAARTTLWVRAGALPSHSSDSGQLTIEQTAYADFSQAALVATLSHLPAVATNAASVDVASAVLELLSYRVERQRQTPQDKGSTELFETVIAAHLAVRSALGTDGTPSLRPRTVESRLTHLPQSRGGARRRSRSHGIDRDPRRVRRRARQSRRPARGDGRCSVGRRSGQRRTPRTRAGCLAGPRAQRS